MPVRFKQVEAMLQFFKRSAFIFQCWKKLSAGAVKVYIEPTRFELTNAIFQAERFKPANKSLRYIVTETSNIQWTKNPTINLSSRCSYTPCHDNSISSFFNVVIAFHVAFAWNLKGWTLCVWHNFSQFFVQIPSIFQKLIKFNQYEGVPS